MNAEECATVQRLISRLDHSRCYYRTLKRHLRDAHAHFLVSRMIDLSEAAADDLTRQMLLTGGLAASRGGGALTRLRAQAAYCMTIGSTDRDAACLKHLAHHGDQVMQRFQAVIARVEELRPHLHYQLLALERARFRIESFANEIDAWSSADDAFQERLVARLSSRQRFHR